MKITIHNYEAYLLDLSEGTLDISKKQELNDFMNLHPELNPDFDFSSVSLNPEYITYANKNSLRKFDFDQKITRKNFEDFCIAFHEHLLTEEQQKRLIASCNSKEKIKTFDLYGRTYLKPQMELVFGRKNVLYRKKFRKTLHGVSLRKIIIPFTAAAASIAIILTFDNKKDEIKSDFTQVPNKETAIIFQPEKIMPQTIKTTKVINLYSVPKKRIVTATEEQRTDIQKKPDYPLLASLPIKLSSAGRRELALAESKTETYPDDNKNLLQIASKVLMEIKQTDLRKIKKPRITFAGAFKAGIEGINSVTESEMRVTEKKDSLGNITAYSFESRLLKFHHISNE